MAVVLGGAKVVESLNGQVAEDVRALRARGIVPTLAIVRVGECGDDISYERGAMRRAEKVGVAVRSVVLAADTTQGELVGTLQALNADASVHGVLLFRPLPEHIDEGFVRNVLAPEKDVDGITDRSLAGVFTDAAIGYAPCTPTACMEVLDYFGIDVRGKTVVVVGRSLVVGKPVAMMLLGRHATVTLAHSRTVNLPSVIRGAEIVISCAGRAGLLDAGCLVAGQTVIDVSINVTEEGSLVGDVDYGAALGVVAAITPVPGGVGAVTTSVLMKHVTAAAWAQE
jgi:methylenetetrahydrofolate dehydrogenase (NADP+)/methenyltetrahydrofolate cyclohydrolase